MIARTPLVFAQAALSILAACGTSAVDVDACRQIEAARCQRAPSCNISVEPPHRTSGSDIDGCIRFYNDACLHGLVAGNAPGPPALSACIAAIRTGACPSAVLTPETFPACSWLAPSSAASTDNGDAQ